MKLFSLLLVPLLAGAVLSYATGTQEAGPPKAEPKPDKLVVIGHSVHRANLTQGPGGNVAQDWSQASGVANIEWITLGVTEIGDKLLREATLPSTTIDVGFILNTVLSPEIANLFEPLDAYMAKEPLEDFSDIFPGMRNATKFGGKTYAIPFRHATNVLHYNEQLFSDVGIGGAPATMDDLVAFIPKLKYKRPDGSQVYGFVYPGKRMQTHTVTLARGWDGDFVTQDYKCVATGYGFKKAVTILRELYAGGYYPEAFPTLANTDVDTWVQQGRVAMSFSTGGRTGMFNDAKQSKFPGKVKIAPVPIAKELAGKYNVAPTTFEFWSLGIPKNSQHKQAAWDFIKFVSSKKSALRAALNGNGPVRDSTYTDRDFQSTVPYWKAEQLALAAGRVPVPGYAKSIQAEDLLNEYLQAAILGKMSVDAALERLQREVSELLPK